MYVFIYEYIPKWLTWPQKRTNLRFVVVVVVVAVVVVVLVLIVLVLVIVVVLVLVVGVVVVVASSFTSWTAKCLLNCVYSFLHCHQDVTGILWFCSSSEISEQEVRTTFAPIHFNAFHGEVNLGLLSDPNSSATCLLSQHLWWCKVDQHRHTGKMFTSNPNPTRNELNAWMNPWASKMLIHRCHD